MYFYMLFVYVCIGILILRGSHISSNCNVLATFM